LEPDQTALLSLLQKNKNWQSRPLEKQQLPSAGKSKHSVISAISQLSKFFSLMNLFWA
jgi:hypothetical protein